MKTAKQSMDVSATASHFNVDKLQAAICMAASAAVSIALTWYAIRLF